MGPVREPLTPDKCQDIIVHSTPDPQRFKPDSDPSSVTLFDLGVVGATESAVFVRAVKNRLRPWQINDGDVASSPDKTVQQAADSVGENAF
jgi:hypothetical protein